MAYKTGSVKSLILPANIIMTACSALSAVFFCNQDYLAGWIAALVTLVIVFGIPDYTKRILTHVSILIDSFNLNKESELQIPLFADELQDIDLRLKNMKSNLQKTQDTSQLSSILMENIIQHVPFAIIVFDEEGKIYYANETCKNILGDSKEYITAYPFEHQNLISAWKNIPDNQQIIFSDETSHKDNRFLISKKIFSFRETTFSLVSLKSIKSELESHESASWQKIIRVLNHEIMNSLTPVSSLAQSIIDKKTDSPTPKYLNMVYDSLALISRRSLNLVNFVNKYRELNVIPEPQMEVISPQQLMSDTMALFQQDFNSLNFTPETEIDPDISSILLDPALFQQVLINLIKNSIQALNSSPAPALKVSFRIQSARFLISVSDNGCGITEQAKENVFVPFFTTKKGGSGIGLALVKQIVRLHHGEITFSSIPRVETTFTITLPLTFS